MIFSHYSQSETNNLTELRLNTPESDDSGTEKGTNSLLNIS